jgi:hypothetical protein
MMWNQIAFGLNLFLSDNNICLPINVILFTLVSFWFYTMTLVIMLLFEVFHEPHFFKLGKCIQLFDFSH